MTNLFGMVLYDELFLIKCFHKKTAGTTPRLTLTKLTKPNLMNYNVTSDLK